jgi:hypothetical protein
MTFNKDEIIFKKISQFNSEKDSENLRDGSGISSLRHLGTWKGDDFEECLQTVYDNRSQVEP